MLWDSCRCLRDGILARLGTDRPNYETVWVDLAAVTLIDSVGIGVLVGVKVTCQRLRVRLVLAQPSPRVATALADMKLESIFEIVAWQKG